MDKRRDIARELARKYGTLSTTALDRLSQLLVPMRVAKGASIVKSGEVCENIYYIERGLVRQTYEKNGMTLTEHIAYEGSIIMCIESLFQQTPSRLSIETIEPSFLYALPFAPFQELTHTAYEYCQLLFSILQESLIISQQKADTLRFETAKERYLRTLHDHPDIIRRTPLHIVASYLQMTPETLSRVRTAINQD